MKQFIIASLPKKQLYAALISPDRHQRVICGQVDLDVFSFCFIMGDGTNVHGPLDVFSPSGDGTRPDFAKFKITDYGLTVSFGDYEIAADFIGSEFNEKSLPD